MALFRKDVLATAEKLVSKGRIEAAIKEYRKVLAKTPGDTNTLNRVGDLYVRLRKTEEAVGYYMKTAEQYALDGFYVKAIAVYKKVHRLDPSHVEVHRRLGELYRKQGLLNDALRHFNLVAEASLRDGKQQDAISLYEQLIELEPTNPTNYLRLADIHRESGKLAEALVYYGRIAGLMLSHGQIDHAIQVYERALQVDASNLDFISEAVVALKDAGGEERARSFLQSAVAANPAADQLESLITPPKVMPQSSLLGGDRAIPSSPGEVAAAPPSGESTDRSATSSRVTARGTSAQGDAPWPAEEAAPPGADAQARGGLASDPSASRRSPARDDAFVAEDYDPSEDSAAFEFEPEPDLELDLPPKAASDADDEVELDPLAELLEAAPVEPAEAASAAAPAEVDSQATPALAEAEESVDLGGVLDLPKAPLPADFPGVSEDTPPSVSSDFEAEQVSLEPQEIETDAPAGRDAGLQFLDDALDDEAIGSSREVEEPSALDAAGALDALADEDSQDAPAEEIGPLELGEVEEPEFALEMGDHSASDLDEVAAGHEDEIGLTIEPVAEQAAEEAGLDELDELDAAAAERLQEAEVFAKYGLIEKALERLDEVLEAEPEHVPTLARWLELGLGVRPLDDAVVRARALLRQTNGEGELWDAAAPALREAGLEVDGQQISLPTTPADAASLGLSSFASAGAAREDSPAAQSEPSELVPAAPSETSADQTLAESDAPEESAAPETVAGAEVDFELESTTPQVAEEEASEELPAELVEELSSVEDSRGPELPAEVVTGDESISAATWLREPDESEDGGSLFEEEEELFDLAAELQDELGEVPRASASAESSRSEGEQSLEEIVEGFKKGVSENIPQEDADTHYNLGIAYREMLLLDEAITEFEISAKAEAFLVESCAMLGICFRDKGQPEAAIDWYRKALDSDQLGPEQRLGMLYEIGQTYESMSDEERAYETFLQIYDENSNYRDISDCVERLRPAS